MSIQKKGLGRGLGDLISQSTIPVSLRPSSFANNTTAVRENTVPLSYGNSNVAVKQESVVELASPVPTVSEEQLRRGPQVVFLEIDKVVANPTQPRQTFDDNDIEELAHSIKSKGVLQAILVRPAKGSGGVYEIVAGERRWRAAQKAGLREIPAMLRELNDLECLEIALIENVQRQNLNSVDEGQAYQRLITEHGLTQEEVADRVGKDRATVSNFIRLLKLSPAVLKLLREEKISVGHAKAILPVKDATAQSSLAKKVVEEGLSVRSLEALVSTAVVLDGQREAALRGKDYTISGKRNLSQVAFPEIVDRLRNFLGTKVAIRHSRRGKGRIEIEYFSEQELERIVESILKDP